MAEILRNESDLAAHLSAQSQSAENDMAAADQASDPEAYFRSEPTDQCELLKGMVCMKLDHAGMSLDEAQASALSDYGRMLGASLSAALSAGNVLKVDIADGYMVVPSSTT